MDFPASLDAGASIPQELLESVGQAINDISSSVWKLTTKIITHGVDKLFVAATAGFDYDPNNDQPLLFSSPGCTKSVLDLQFLLEFFFQTFILSS
ncbi:hypothetical protein CMV_007657 [Castanea mollissima]|uniref:Uncharacterized protein n=1 Tax=Castanea mollissima TaxID=60419 RepID=A0A8J4R9S3_9ROSI|nr:hypothetical protein CMV_007657 [Castanea mollissima]